MADLNRNSFRLHPSLAIFYFDSLPSTNGFLKEEIEAGRILQAAFCMTANQTAGYGQHGRVWDSNQMLAPLTFTFAFPIDYAFDKLLLKSVPVALIVQGLLTHYSSQEFQVKWPNDIYSHGKKVAGCLIEVVKSKSLQKRFVVFGLGINQSKGSNEDYGSAPNLDVLPFLEALSNDLYNFFISDQPPNSEETIEKWLENDYFSVGERVSVYDSDSFKEGVYLGINSRFQPEVRIDGQTCTFSTGQASIRKV